MIKINKSNHTFLFSFQLNFDSKFIKLLLSNVQNFRVFHQIYLFQNTIHNNFMAIKNSSILDPDIYASQLFFYQSDHLFYRFDQFFQLMYKLIRLQDLIQENKIHFQSFSSHNQLYLINLACCSLILNLDFPLIDDCLHLFSGRQKHFFYLIVFLTTLLIHFFWMFGLIHKLVFDFLILILSYLQNLQIFYQQVSLVHNNRRRHVRLIQCLKLFQSVLFQTFFVPVIQQIRVSSFEGSDLKIEIFPQFHYFTSRLVSFCFCHFGMTNFTSGKLFVLFNQLNDDFGEGREVSDLFRSYVLYLGETLGTVKTESKDEVIGNALTVLATFQLLKLLQNDIFWFDWNLWHFSWTLQFNNYKI